MPTLGFTPNVQKLLIQSYNRGYICFREQRIYDSSKYYEATTWLRNNNLIKPICSICKRELKDENGICKKKDREHKNGNKMTRYYSLTFWGEVWAIGLLKLKY